jgi:hypothetical protein
MFGGVRSQGRSQERTLLAIMLPGEPRMRSVRVQLEDAGGRNERLEPVVSGKKHKQLIVSDFRAWRDLRREAASRYIRIGCVSGSRAWPALYLGRVRRDKR